MDKVVASARGAVADIRDGATILIGGFGVVQGWPTSLLEALRDHGAGDLTLVANTPGVGPTSPQLLAEAGLVRKLVASYALYPKQRTPMDAAIRSGRVALELVPQGTLIERIRAGRVLHSHRRRYRRDARSRGPRVRRTALRPRDGAPRRRRARASVGRGPARQPRLPARVAQLQSGDGDGRAPDDRRGGRRRRS